MSKWRRPGATYIFFGWDPYALLRGKLRVVVLYVGKTRRRVETRWREHMKGAPGVPPKLWAPLVTDVHTLKEWRRITDLWLSVREAWSINWHSPRANIALNKANAKRIPPWEMQRLMFEINRRGGVAVLVEKARRPVEKGLRLDNGRVVERYGARAERV